MGIFTERKAITFVTKCRKEQLRTKNLSEILLLEDDYEFIWGLYLKFDKGKAMSSSVEENLKEFKELNDEKKKYIIARINKIEDINTPTSLMGTIITVMFATYVILYNIISKVVGEDKGLFISFWIQFIVLFGILLSNIGDKSYKSKCVFLLKLLS